MKKIIYITIMLFGFLNGFSTEKDSLLYQKYFKTISLKSTVFEDYCDACGCSASGGSMGFASMLNSNFVGLRYFNQSYKSNDGLYNNSPWYDENFNTIQVWTRFPIVKNIQISALVPYHFHNRESATGKQDISGIGDATLIGMYTLFQTTKDSVSVYHTFQLGGGIKMPLGKFDEANNGSVNPSYQVGTGSWDYLLASEYVIKRNNFGLNTMLNYVVKTENEKNYRFGNQFNYASTLFYLIENNKFSIVPQIGIAGEVYEDNYQLNQKIRGTAGDIFMGKIGFELGKDKFSFGANTMLPINQNLTGGNVKANYRLSINLNYSL
jgi:hypothetical protein